MTSLVRLLASLLFILAGAWLGLSLFVFLLQDRYIYYPDKTLVATPRRIGLAFENVSLLTADGIRLNGWFIPSSGAQTTLLFLHGNAGNISHRLDSLRLFHELGVNVFILDYRGYGHSGGVPSEQGTYRDAEAAWRYLTQTRHIPAAKIVVFGRSLGGAVAVWLAGHTAPAALILESTFTSVRDMAARYYPYLPVSLLLHTRYPTLGRIAALHLPTLIVHSRDDEIIPYEFGRRLFAAVQGPAEFLTLQGSHNDAFLSDGTLYRDGLASFLRRYSAE
jgi:fermentation-respiration switch protein FrsA (DUF1100 family)